MLSDYDRLKRYNIQLIVHPDPTVPSVAPHTEQRTQSKRAALAERKRRRELDSDEASTSEEEEEEAAAAAEKEGGGEEEIAGEENGERVSAVATETE